MTKMQYYLNILFFLPLIIINFVFYGLDGVINLFKEMKKFSKIY